MLDIEELEEHFRKTICSKIRVLRTDMCPGLGGYLCIGCEKFLGPSTDRSCPNLGRDTGCSHCRHEKVVNFKTVYDTFG